MAKPFRKADFRKWDTPTDGVSRKVFDRYKDQQTTRYVRVSNDIRSLEQDIKVLRSMLSGGSGATEEE